MTVSIIGSGNIAWHLVNVLEETGIEIAELYARNKKKGEAITGYIYDVKIKTDLDFRNSHADVFVMAVSDDAIDKLASQILLPSNAVLCHTSGAKSINALLPALDGNPSVKLGVFYPLMTFTKGLRVEFQNIPLCIEGEDDGTFMTLSNLAKQISKKVQKVNSYHRSILHVAAVFACNFTNHLWALSHEIVSEEDLEFDMLKPLILETVQKAMKSEHPSSVQTGPALREDVETISKHRNLLKDDLDLLKVYDSLTKSIQDWHQ